MAMLGIQPRALGMLGKHSVTEDGLTPLPLFTFILRQGLVKLPKLALNFFFFLVLEPKLPDLVCIWVLERPLRGQCALEHVLLC